MKTTDDAGHDEAASLVANSAAKSVIIFIKDRNGAEDPYASTFTAAGFDCSFIPAIAFEYKNLSTLTEHITLAAVCYSGIVATSPRGVQSFIDALANVSDTTLNALSSVPLYVVGDGSANVVTASSYAVNINVVAFGGSASALGEYIKQRLLADADAATVKPLLIISGNLRRENIFDALKPVAVVEVQTYDTIDHPDLYNTFASAISSPPLSSCAAQNRWIAFFSPSAVSAIQRHYKQEPIHISQWNIACIGPTTAAAITSVGWKCAAVAATPSPESMLQAIHKSCE